MQYFEKTHSFLHTNTFDEKRNKVNDVGLQLEKLERREPIYCKECRRREIKIRAEISETEEIKESKLVL